MRLNGKNILVYGLSKTGEALINFLSKFNCTIYVVDDNKEIQPYLNFKNVFPFSEYLLKYKFIDFVIVSPGVPLKSSKIISKAKENKIKIYSEIEFAYQFCKTKNIIGVTGTNGKTTVTELIYHMLSQNHKTFKCGNIGIPFISVVNEINKNDFVVIELSSFQLEEIKKFRPKIAILLNLKPDHLNRYKNEIEYYNAKLNIFKCQHKKDFCILNYDDINLNNLTKKIKPKKYFFSTKNLKDCFLANNKIFLNTKNNDAEFVFDISQSQLKGEHNIKNLMVAILVGKILKLSNLEIQNALKSFYPLPHRLETVCIKNGITYINDSKATNIDATINALSAFKDRHIHLLLGGSDKGENFDILFKNLSDNVCSYIYGETKDKMVTSAKNVEYDNYRIYNILTDALDDVKNYLNVGDIVLLSPACASFDEFNSFEERGEYFTRWVKENG